LAVIRSARFFFSRVFVAQGSLFEIFCGKSRVFVSRTVRLAAGDAVAVIALKGAEPVALSAGGRDLLWQTD
jgi:hypothetical protein